MLVRQRLQYNIYIFIFKILNDMLSTQLRDRLQIGNAQEKRDKRVTLNFNLEKQSSQKSLFYEGVTMYNALRYQRKNNKKL